MRQLKIAKQVTNRDTASVDKYLQEIARVSLISAEEEVLLAQRIKQGDRAALEKLTKANLRFVVSVSKQYLNQGLSLPDLINEGNLGLLKAATKFDETRGFKFISYAVWWIRQSILNALAEQARIVRLPLNKIGSLNKINKTIAMLEQKYEREPFPHEIADVLSISEEEVKQTLQHAGRPVSMDAPLVQGEEITMLEVLQNNEEDLPEKKLLTDSLRIEIERVVGTLKAREAQIIRLYYGLDGFTPHTLEEIGEKLMLTRERVRQVKENALRKLKLLPKCKNLKSYLG
ncbi:MAG TPA: RNA polymerase subunit sigma [Bacteroidales bacterium]|nr:RNA polymerase subunit sigma [Bacteroidales bacterium]